VKLSDLHKNFSDNNSLIKVDKTDGIKFFLTNDEWVLIRESGTEPLLRIYIESHSEEKINLLKNKVLSFLEIEF
jgi:phosphoglucomutase